ncbi:uncharacterized protein B0T15DRAFT_364483, partial [Chaetomium strumarium]
FCEPCVMGKATDELGKRAPTEATRPFHFVRMDTTSYKDRGHLGYKSAMHIIDVWSSYHWVKYGKTKGEMFERLKEWFIQV